MKSLGEKMNIHNNRMWFIPCAVCRVPKWTQARDVKKGKSLICRPCSDKNKTKAHVPKHVQVFSETGPQNRMCLILCKGCAQPKWARKTLLARNKSLYCRSCASRLKELPDLSDEDLLRIAKINKDAKTLIGEPKWENLKANNSTKRKRLILA